MILLIGIVLLAAAGVGGQFAGWRTEVQTFRTESRHLRTTSWNWRSASRDRAWLAPFCWSFAFRCRAALRARPTYAFAHPARRCAAVQGIGADGAPRCDLAGSGRVALASGGAFARSRTTGIRRVIGSPSTTPESHRPGRVPVVPGALATQAGTTHDEPPHRARASGCAGPTLTPPQTIRAGSGATAPWPPGSPQAG